MPRPARSSTAATRLLTVLLAAALAAALLVLSLSGPLGTRATAVPATVPGTAASGTAASAAPAPAPALPVTPGHFYGYGFDQCLAPDQRAMDAWLRHSPFLAVGIYISGDSRACRSQPNLTRTWIATQLRRGWRLLPITLGPQASCQPRFPRYRDDFKISANPGTYRNYGIARRQGVAEARRSVDAAKALGIPARSTLWYDLEGFNHDDTRCRESALRFISGWVQQVRALGYRTGVYSSAASGIKMLDDARVRRPGRFHLPDAIWIARWDGVANTSTSYIRNDGWRPGRRVKQYMGGHDEVWGGVRINIDRNFLDLGRRFHVPPEKRCGGVRVGFWRYDILFPRRADGTTAPAAQVRALQCLLTEKRLYSGGLGGQYTPRLIRAVRAWQHRTGFPVQDIWTRANWMSLFAEGGGKVLKLGSAGAPVHRVQRALNAAYPGDGVRPHGRFDLATVAAVRRWQRDAGLRVTGIVNGGSWRALARARR